MAKCSSSKYKCENINVYHSLFDIREILHWPYYEHLPYQKLWYGSSVLTVIDLLHLTVFGISALCHCRWLWLFCWFDAVLPCSFIPTLSGIVRSWLMCMYFGISYAMSMSNVCNVKCNVWLDYSIWCITGSLKAEERLPLEQWYHCSTMMTSLTITDDLMFIHYSLWRWLFIRHFIHSIPWKFYRYWKLTCIDITYCVDISIRALLKLYSGIVDDALFNWRSHSDVEITIRYFCAIVQCSVLKVYDDRCLILFIVSTMRLWCSMKSYSCDDDSIHYGRLLEVTTKWWREMIFWYWWHSSTVPVSQWYWCFQYSITIPWHSYMQMLIPFIGPSMSYCWWRILSIDTCYSDVMTSVHWCSDVTVILHYDAIHWKYSNQ